MPNLLLTNVTPYPFVGWVPFTMPADGGDATLLLDGQRLPVLAGRRFSASGRMAYVYASLLPASQTGGELVAPDRDLVPPPYMWDPVESVVRLGGNALDMVWEQTVDWPARTSHALLRAGAFVVEMWIHQLAGAKASVWELMIVASDPTVPDTWYWIEQLSLQMANGWLPISHDRWRKPPVYDGNALVLASQETLSDSQALAFSGAFVQPDPSAFAHTIDRPWAVCDLWDENFGPLDSPVQMGAAASQVATMTAREFVERTWSRGLLLTAPPLGLSPNANQTGGQNEFGAMKGLGCFAEAAYLALLYRSAMQEACRPGKFREISGQPVKAWEHPNWVTWGPYTHFHPSVSSDRLGKPPGTPSFAGGWGGPDREHWSIHTLTAAVLLTGSPMLQRILDSHASLVLSGETIDPRLSTSHSGAPRGIGRTLHTAADLAVSLELGDLRTRMISRIEERLRLVLEPATASVRSDPYGYAIGTIDDPRALGSGVQAVSWQEPLALMGLGAWAQLGLGGHEVALAIFRRAAPGWLAHLWFQDASGRFGMWDYVDFYDLANHRRSEGFEEWSGAALIMCKKLLEPGEARDRAIAILAQYHPQSINEHEWLAVNQ